MRQVRKPTWLWKNYSCISMWASSFCSRHAYQGTCFQYLRLAKMILFITAPSMKISKSSDALAHTFPMYQWREALFLCLQNFILEVTLINPEAILEAQKNIQCNNMMKFLQLISEHKIISISKKPHSTFFLSSENIFTSTCFDWLLASFLR